jgi:hypothetical protein
MHGASGEYRGHIITAYPLCRPRLPRPLVFFRFSTQSPINGLKAVTKKQRRSRNMGRYGIALVVLLPALRAVVSQITTPGCYIGSPISVMPACNRLLAVPSVCSGIFSRTDLLGCMCKQQHINDIVE